MARRLRGHILAPKRFAFESAKRCPDAGYRRSMARLRAAGVNVGDKLNSHQFVEDVELLGAAAARVLRAEIVHRLLPGLGIPSDLAVIFDGVSISARQFSRHETLELIWATLFCPYDAAAMGLEAFSPPAPGY